MAPPRHRDRGFSRRIQYGLFFGYVVAAAGIVAGLALILVARFDPLAFQGIRGLALDLTAPISGVGRGIALGADGLGDDVDHYVNAIGENHMLRRELAGNRRALIEARAIMIENARLKQLLHLVEAGERPMAVARVVGSDLAGNRRYATLAAGTAEGVRAGEPVRGPEGLIGRIGEAGLHAARVVLLTDGGSAVPVRVARTGQPALVIGHGDGGLDVRATVTGVQPFRRGDLLVTSGTGGVYPAGVPVAVVTQVSGEVASGRPLTDPATLDFALVLPEMPAPPAPPQPIGAAR